MRKIARRLKKARPDRRGRGPQASRHAGRDLRQRRTPARPEALEGETFWYISNGVSKPFFEKLLALFAREAGAGRERIVILVIDGAGWHTEPNLKVPDGLRLVYLPPYTPQLQPAECLWPVLDEPVANKYFETIEELDAVVAERCLTLDANPELFKGRTNFHWWPKTIQPK